MKTICLCSSASFYKDVLAIEEQLKAAGYEALIPSTANRMKQNNDFTVERYKTWLANEQDYHKKKALMDEHFAKVMAADAILMVNLEKNGIAGYIGGNGLMEMVIAYHYKKPIYIWNEVGGTHPFEEEIKGMGAIPIHQDIAKLGVITSCLST